MKWIDCRRVVDLEKGISIPASHSEFIDKNGEKVLVTVLGNDRIIFEQYVADFDAIVKLEVSWDDLAVILKKYYFISERG